MNVVPSMTMETLNKIGQAAAVRKTVYTYDTGNTFYWVNFGVFPWSTSSFPLVYGSKVRQDDYDYGSGSAGGLLRSTLSTFKWQQIATYLGNNLLTIPYSSTVNDSTGHLAAYTYYGYDESTLQPSGIAEQKVAGESSPGNQTSVHRWLSGSTVATTNCNVSVSNGYLVSQMFHYDTGKVQKSTDPCNNSTTYQYSSTYYGAYPTTVTNPINQITNYSYDFDMGLVTSITDPNSQTTTTKYDAFSRLASVSYPDGGLMQYCYSDIGGPGPNCSQSGPPYSVVTTKAITSAPLNEMSTVVLDGLGRISQTQLNSDITTTTYTLTTYDSLGRKPQVYNPTRCYPLTSNCGETTWGYTTTSYDALN